MRMVGYACSGEFGGEKNPWDAVGEDARKAVINRIHQNGPMTVKQLSESLGLSTSAVHKHVQILLDVGLIKEVPADDKRTYKVEKYYDLDIPVVTFEDKEILAPVYSAMADRILEIYKDHAKELLQAFEKTSMRKKDWKGTDAIVQWLLFNVKPGDPLDGKLEKIGLKPSWEKRPGYRGFFWGTEFEEDEEPYEIRGTSIKGEIKPRGERKV